MPIWSLTSAGELKLQNMRLECFFPTIGKGTLKRKFCFVFFKKHAKENTFSVFLKCLSLLKEKALKTKTKARDTFLSVSFGAQ